MSLKRPTGNSRRKIIPAIALMVVVLFSGTSYTTNVFANTGNFSPDLHVAAITPIPQFSLTEWAVPSTSGGPVGIGIDNAGKVWITENATSKLASFDPTNKNFTEWSTPSTQSQPRNLFVKEVSISGVNYTQVFFTEYAANAIARFNVANNTFTEWHLAPGANPVGIYVDENNDIWFTESGRDAIGRIHTSNNNLTEWTLPGATTTPGSPLLTPWGIYVQVITPLNVGYTNRFVWFTETTGNMIGRLEANSNRLTLWNLNTLGTSFHPTDITHGTVTSIPSIIFSDANADRISILWNDTGGALSSYMDSVIPTVGSGPTGVTFDSSRSAIWFAEINAGKIASLNTTNVFTPISLTADYCTIPPPVGVPSCPSPATMTSNILSSTVTANAPASSQTVAPLETSNVGILQGPVNGFTEYNITNTQAEPRPDQMALDSANNLWFTESNATVNRIGRLSTPYAFQVSVSPTSRIVNKGQTATYDVKVALTSGGPLPVQLSLVNAPQNVTALFNPQTQDPPFASTLTIATTDATLTGNYTMNVHASSGGQNQTIPITLTVQIAPPPPPPAFGYSINVTSTSTVTIPQGGAASFGLVVTLTSGTSQSVSLNYAGLPPLATASFSNPSGLPTFTSQLDIQTGADTPAGSYPITITGMSSGGSPQHPAESPVLVITALFRDFNISSPVSQVILVQGSRDDIPITVTSIGAFNGIVNLDASFSPLEIGLGASFSPANVQLIPGEAGSTTMEIIAFKDTSGTYQLTITGTSSNPSKTHQIVIGVRVSPCIIATATFGSELAPEVQFLRDFRDQQIMQTFAGSNFMQVFNAWYYSFSPAVAQYEYTHSTTRFMIKQSLYPLMGILHLASSTYALLGFEPEAAALVAGLLASSLIGVAYLALPLSAVLWLERKRVSAKTKRRVAKWIAVAFVTLFAGFAVSELFTLPVLMMAASAAIVLTALLVGSIMPALELVEYFKRRT
ncbi:MAG: CFI-box-CTERM domain-containing protein [Candidatus Bathyarchaeia archaeon]|jgi:streptogramin lyase